jgi:mono/diheme cytochrome c family protein
MARHGLAPVALAALVLAGGTVAGAGVKRVSAPHLSTVDGATLYQAYCASCHGPAARGDGRASGMLSAPVPDLTRIAARDGRYDVVHVSNHLRWQTAPPDTMPHFHQVLKSNYASADDLTVLAEYNLSKYLESLQEK